MDPFLRDLASWLQETLWSVCCEVTLERQLLLTIGILEIWSTTYFEVRSMLLFWEVYRGRSCTVMKQVCGWQFHPPGRSSSWWKVLCPSGWACAMVWVWQGGLRLNLDSNPRRPLQTVSDWCCTDSGAPLSFVWDHLCSGGRTGQTKTKSLFRKSSWKLWILTFESIFDIHLLPVAEWWVGGLPWEASERTGVREEAERRESWWCLPSSAAGSQGCDQTQEIMPRKNYFYFLYHLGPYLDFWQWLANVLPDYVANLV